MKRAIKSFEADKDVLRMLERATGRDGIKLGHICNEAVRRYLHNAGYARKKDCKNKEGTPAVGIRILREESK